MRIYIIFSIFAWYQYTKFSFLMKFLYYLLFGSWLLSLLPLRLLYVLSDILFYPLFYIVRYRREVVRKNLRECFPEKTEQEILQIEKKFFHFFCDLIIEDIKLFSISKKEVMKRMEFVGIDEMSKQLEKENKKLCFVYLGHYCNWEYVASLAYWCPNLHSGQIYHRIYNPAFDKLFLKLRGQFGGESILMRDTLRRMISLNRGEKSSIIGFISDQLPKWENMSHWVPFLNHETSFFTGAERIGKKMDTAFYYLEVNRVKRGYYRAVLHPITLHSKGYPDFELTDIFIQKLEKQIKEEPAYWLWTHKRWKRTKEQWLQWKKENNQI